MMSGENRTSPAAPEPDLDSKFFWDGLKKEKLLLQRCDGCGRVRFPAMPRCPYCASAEATTVQASGAGNIYSWIVVHRAFDAAFAEEVPFTLATVDLKEGARIVGRLEGAPPQFGMGVRATYFNHANWTELRFEPQGTEGST